MSEFYVIVRLLNKLFKYWHSLHFGFLFLFSSSSRHSAVYMQILDPSFLINNLLGIISLPWSIMMIMIAKSLCRKLHVFQIQSIGPETRFWMMSAPRVKLKIQL